MCLCVCWLIGLFVGWLFNYLFIYLFLFIYFKQIFTNLKMYDIFFFFFFYYINILQRDWWISYQILALQKQLFLKDILLTSQDSPVYPVGHVQSSTSSARPSPVLCCTAVDSSTLLILCKQQLHSAHF